MIQFFQKILLNYLRFRKFQLNFILRIGSFLCIMVGNKLVIFLLSNDKTYNISLIGLCSLSQCNFRLTDRNNEVYYLIKKLPIILLILSLNNLLIVQKEN